MVDVGKNLWTEKFKLIKEQIPSFLDQNLAEKILVAGKSVIFLRQCCETKDWFLDLKFVTPSETLQDFSIFKNWVEQASTLTNKKLVEVLFTKFHFKGHLESIKRYLLMGQGDFIQNLMDQMPNELNKAASMIYRHNLLGIVEGAVRSSNAQFHNPEFLQRLDVKLFEPSPGDNGWDIFSLDYKIDTPINTVLNAKNMKQYLRIFNFLWRIKRVEHALNEIWIQHMNSKSIINKIRGFKPEFHK